MSNKNWKDNTIQFPRLIAELEAIGVFTEANMIKLAVEMDLSQLEVAELIDRACSEWDNTEYFTAELTEGENVIVPKEKLGIIHNDMPQFFEHVCKRLSDE